MRNQHLKLETPNSITSFLIALRRTTALSVSYVAHIDSYSISLQAQMYRIFLIPILRRGSLKYLVKIEVICLNEDGIRM